jgi:DNA-directed RNA polymerase specialized sigma24 family protein
MEESEGSVRGVSLRAAACMLAGDVRDRVAGERLRRAVDAQLRRAGVEAQDADDVRTEVVLALLCAPAAELLLPLELVCARAAVIARNKAIDHGRRGARAPIALGAELPEPAPPGERPGSLADGLDEVAAAAHRRRVHADLARALDRLDAAQRAAISAHASGGAARAAGLPRSTYYRALAHAQARLRSDLRGRLTGLGALGDLARGARELFAHVEGAHAAAAAATAAVAVTAAVGLNWHDEGAPRLVPSVVVQRSSGGRVQPASIPPSQVRALSRRVTGPARSRAASASRPVPAAAMPSPASRSYDPSTYDP